MSMKLIVPYIFGFFLFVVGLWLYSFIELGGICAIVVGMYYFAVGDHIAQSEQIDKLNQQNKLLNNGLALLQIKLGRKKREHENRIQKKKSKTGKGNNSNINRILDASINDTRKDTSTKTTKTEKQSTT